MSSDLCVEELAEGFLLRPWYRSKSKVCVQNCLLHLPHTGYKLQTEVTPGRFILYILSRISRISWSFFHRKELIFYVRPGRLAALHDFFQSMRGLSLSTWQRTSSLEPGSPEWVTFTSSRYLYHAFTVIDSISSDPSFNATPMRFRVSVLEHLKKTLLRQLVLMLKLLWERCIHFPRANNFCHTWVQLGNFNPAILQVGPKSGVIFY